MIAIFKKLNINFLLHIFFYLFCFCAILLVLVCFYYFSLAIECYLQMQRAGKFSNEQALYVSKKSGHYRFQKDIYMTYERVKFQTYAGRIYLYVRKGCVNEDDLKNVVVDVSRDCYNLVDSYRYTYKNLKQSSAYFQKPGYYSFWLPPVAMYPSYNQVTISLSGLDLPNPHSDIKIFLYFCGHKGQTIFLSLLIMGAKYFAALMFFVIASLLLKRFRKLANLNGNQNE